MANKNEFRDFKNNRLYDSNLADEIKKYYQGGEQIELLDTYINIMIDDTHILFDPNVENILSTIRNCVKNVWSQFEYVHMLDTDIGELEWANNVIDYDADDLFSNNIYIDDDELVLSFRCFMAVDDMYLIEDELKICISQLTGASNIIVRFREGRRRSINVLRAI